MDSAPEKVAYLAAEEPMQDDVPPGVDFHDAAAAAAWAGNALAKNPWRGEFFERFVTAITNGTEPARRVLELGAGPGFPAEYLLDHCPGIESYTLLDFSEAMLDLSRDRLSNHEGRAKFAKASFKEAAWTAGLHGPFDFVVTMQAVHELRNKRHAPTLYEQVRSVLRPGGILLVCDYLPERFEYEARHTLYMTVDEHLDALAAFPSRECLAADHGMALYRASV